MNSEIEVKPIALTRYEQWMVKSNLKRIQDGEFKAADLIALLRSRGYHNIASAVELEYLKSEANSGHVITIEQLVTVAKGIK